MNDLTDRLIARINELEARLARLESSDRKLGDIQLTLGDTAGANKLTMRNSTPTEVFAVDSLGECSTPFVAKGGLSPTAKGYDNFRLGVEAGTPRIYMEDAGSTQWAIDNSSGTLRFFQPGVLKVSVDGNGNLAAVGGVSVPKSNTATIFGVDVSGTGTAVALATNTSTTLFGSQVNGIYSGLLIVNDVTGGSCAAFILGGLGSVLLGESVANAFAATSTANRSCVYYGAGPNYDITLENKGTGVTKTYHIFSVRTRAGA